MGGVGSLGDWVGEDFWSFVLCETAALEPTRLDLAVLVFAVFEFVVLPLSLVLADFRLPVLPEEAVDEATVEERLPCWLEPEEEVVAWTRALTNSSFRMVCHPETPCCCARRWRSLTVLVRSCSAVIFRADSKIGSVVPYAGVAGGQGGLR